MCGRPVTIIRLAPRPAETTAQVVQCTAAALPVALYGRSSKLSSRAALRQVQSEKLSLWYL